MEKFITHTGKLLPLDQANVDTDQIIPKQFLQKTERVGFAQHLFHDWRFLDDHGNIPNPEFVLNQPEYKSASVLLVRENFGCGSSREHAPWSLQEYGFKVIIAPSFADIFYGNCINIGVLPIILSDNQISELFLLAEKNVLTVAVNLEDKTLQVNDKALSFDIKAVHQKSLLEGIDSIGKSLQRLDNIEAFELKIPTWL
ncbi:3-isopropylmalate dehydratase small subunit [Parashewanella tropica]|uniref:3-isopropylmalate dehydratase small subunit n=1 Tax=Parashewanella tropica TaxID=2547970 RepID=UPI001C5558CC|nr:3-isopropylmalate dehydratase small subunit [Parashewanella tropica]